MAITPLSVSVPKPCHENWDDMTTTQKGRHCFSCQKTVVDFSKMSDGEIIRYFQQSKGATCGRFLETQLNRPMVELLVGRPKNKWTWMFPAMLLPFAGFAQQSMSSDSVITIPLEVSVDKASGSETNAISKNKSGSCKPHADKTNTASAESSESLIFWNSEALLVGDVITTTGNALLREEPKMELNDVFLFVRQQLYFLYLGVSSFLKSLFS